MIESHHSFEAKLRQHSIRSKKVLKRQKKRAIQRESIHDTPPQRDKHKMAVGKLESVFLCDVTN